MPVNGLVVHQGCPQAQKAQLDRRLRSAVRHLVSFPILPRREVVAPCVWSALVCCTNGGLSRSHSSRLFSSATLTCMNSFDLSNQFQELLRDGRALGTKRFLRAVKAGLTSTETRPTSPRKGRSPKCPGVTVCRGPCRGGQIPSSWYQQGYGPSRAG